MSQLKTASGHVIKPRVVKAIQRNVEVWDRIIREGEEALEDAQEAARKSDRPATPVATEAEVGT